MLKVIDNNSTKDSRGYEGVEFRLKRLHSRTIEKQTLLTTVFLTNVLLLSITKKNIKGK